MEPHFRKTSTSFSVGWSSNQSSGDPFTASLHNSWKCCRNHLSPSQSLHLKLISFSFEVSEAFMFPSVQFGTSVCLRAAAQAAVCHNESAPKPPDGNLKACESGSHLTSVCEGQNTTSSTKGNRQRKPEHGKMAAV